MTRLVVAAKKTGVFVTAIKNSHLYVTGQIGMKFSQITSVGICYWALIEQFWKFSVHAVISPQNRYFGVALTGLRVTGLQIMGYVFDMATPSIYYRNTNAAPTRIDFLCDYRFGSRSSQSYPNFAKWPVTNALLWHRCRSRKMFPCELCIPS